ncbi:MAG: biotin/lipoyl-binding protein [Anaerolineae bacterium]|nr:biotin/lipoyl-binding protein [Anaerolineae bacterium]MDW8172720.1 biotin/lipoyl-containing protein [Anaerolineae bacterium]
MEAVAVYMPKYGMTMEEGIITEWLVSEGDAVQKGQGIVIIETEKVSTELEAPISGTIIEITCQPGDEIPVGEVIAYIQPSG